MEDQDKKEKRKTELKRYLVCAGVASAIVLGVFVIKGFFVDNAKVNMQILHDAFFVAGALLMIFGGMLFISEEGLFIGVGYAFSRVLSFFIPTINKKDESYEKYRERKLEKKKDNSSITKYVFNTGLLFFLVSLIFLFVWYQL